MVAVATRIYRRWRVYDRDIEGAAIDAAPAG